MCVHSPSFNTASCPLCVLQREDDFYKEKMPSFGIAPPDPLEGPIQSFQVDQGEPTQEASSQAPGLLRKAWNAGKAIGRAAGRALRGKKVLAPLEVVQERRKICDACHMLDVLKDECTHPGCGCRLSARLTVGLAVPGKLEVASESCPLEPPKWKALEG